VSANSPIGFVFIPTLMVIVGISMNFDMFRLTGGLEVASSILVTQSSKIKGSRVSGNPDFYLKP